jgi:hypothetical protein
MSSFLKHHPFAVEAFFESSLVLTFAIPKEELQPFIPECLQLDTFKDEWAFLAVAMVQAKGLRPKGFPSIMGSDFYLVGYRIFVRYVSTAGKRRRGLYILKSETNKKRMEWLGNIFTRYSYSTIDITQEKGPEGTLTISSRKSGFSMRAATGAAQPGLPQGSPFGSWQEARRFAGPLPFTFSYDAAANEVLIVEGVREHWQPSPVQVLRYDIGYLNLLGLKHCKLASAFMVEHIPYCWKKGRTELWKG